MLNFGSLCICQWGGMLSSRGAAHGATRGHLRGRAGPLSLRLLVIRLGPAGYLIVRGVIAAPSEDIYPATQ